jgi:hypothetical protein
MLTVDEAARIGIDWRAGRHQMIVVGDGSYIPTFIHDLPVQIGGIQMTAPIGSLSASVSGLIFSAARACLTSSKFVSTTAPAK